MSSNNQLVIIKKKRGKMFEVHHHLCVDNEFRPGRFTFLKEFPTLEEAINYANEYCREELVEYGVHVGDSCLTKAKKNMKGGLN